MNHKEQPKNKFNHEHTNGSGISSDDMSVLNQVLQQVKGISCVSCPAYEPIELELEQPASE